MALVHRNFDPSAVGGGFSAGDPDFFDDFDYVVTNDFADAAANSAAFAAAGWSGSKGNNCVGGSGGGNVYTELVSNIPGFSGSAPGSTNRALCINSLAYTLSSQTDFYLQLGDGVTAEQIPGNVWFQFWVYPCRSGAQQTAFHTREKFLYPSSNSYPSSTNKWLWMMGSNSHEPLGSSTSNGNAYVFTRDNRVGTVDYSLAEPGDESKIGQTSISEYLVVNRWTLVKVHFDTSGANGTYECWLKAQGGSWVKVAEWIGGVTANFTWTIPAEHQGGHTVMKMPTTFPANDTTPLYDAWIYMQDFAMATSEANLPTYG